MELHLGLTLSELEIYFEFRMVRDKPNIHYKDSKIKGWWPLTRTLYPRLDDVWMQNGDWLSVNFGSLGLLLIQLKFKRSNLGCVNPTKSLERNSRWSWGLLLFGLKLACQHGSYSSILPKMSVWFQLPNDTIQIENYSTDSWKSKMVLLRTLACTG